jgi:hypothetical protein
MSQRIDRRRFLIGSGGAILALPMLEAFAPRTAFAQTAAPPKRLVVVLHPHGRVVGPSNDNWAPRTTTGPLPAVGTAPSPALAALAPINNEIVTLANIDNIVRHTSGDADGHASASATCTTCVVPNVGQARGPSIDYVAGLRLRSGAGQKMALVIPGQAAPFDNSVTENNVFLGPNGSPGNYQDIDPQQLIRDLFASVQVGPPPPPPPTPTLQDRLSARRGSILDAVAQGFTSFRATLNSADQARLDQHAQFIRDTEVRYSAPPPPPPSVAACSPPAPGSVQNLDYWGNFRKGEHDDVFAQAQIETLVQALACDVTRTASLYFWASGDPGFVTEFAPGTSPYVAGNWHASVHGDGSPNDPTPASLTKGFGFYSKYFTKLIQRLAAVTDSDGSRLLDNTLVVWASDLGYGSGHYCYNYPVVLAGMKAAFPKGQGRHVVGQVNSLGDVYAQVLRMLGGTDTTFGSTGTLSSAAGSTSINFFPALGRPGLITKDTPLHFGPLDL